MAGSSSSAAARAHPSSKNLDTILSGNMQYQDWRARLIAAIAREGAKLVTVANPIEDQYRNAVVLNQLTHFNEYDKLQDIAKGILFDRLRDHDFQIIRDCTSFLHMLEELDARYIVTNHAGAVAARTKLQHLRYDGKSDLRNFLHLFEARLDEAILANNIMSEHDKMYQLTSALGPAYVPVLREMSNDPPKQQTFANFELKVLESYDLTKIFAKSEVSHKEPHSSNADKKPNKSADRNLWTDGSNDSSKPPGPRCFGCNLYGHKRPDCPKTKNPQNKPSDQATLAKPKPDSKKDPVDWTKFINMGKNKTGVPKTSANCAFVVLGDNEESAESTFVPGNPFEILEYVQDDSTDHHETELLMDTGANRPMFPNLSYFSDVVKLSNPVKVQCADNRPLFGTHSGSVYMNVKSQNNDILTIVLNNALFVPGLALSLIHI